MITKFKKNFSFKIFIKKKWIIILFLIIFFVGFVIGVAGIRYNYIKNTYYFIKGIPKIIKNYSYFLNQKILDFENVSISMNFKEFQIITENRKRNIVRGHATYTEDDWAKGKIMLTSEDKTFKAKFRLKGTMSDNWINADGKWSFRVKLNGENRYEGMKEFSLMKPDNASGVLEWLFQIIAQDEGLLGLKTKIVKLNLNGKNLGYYYLQEHFSKSIIENNQRREGPIVGYNKDRIVNLWWSDPNQILQNNGFNIADIKITGNYDKLKPDQKRLSKYAIGLLESLRNKNLRASEILDVESTSKLLALRAIIGSSDLDWKDIKFYYNPLTSKLEPILREAHAEYDLFDWWYRGTRQLNTVNVDYTTFEDIIFSDELIYEKYIKYLRNYFFLDIVNKTIEKNKKEYNTIVTALAMSNNLEKWLEKLSIRSKKIKAALLFEDPISAELVDNKFLKIRNFQHFPVSIKKIIINDKTYLTDDNQFVVQGKINDEKYYDHLFDLNFENIDLNLLSNSKIKDVTNIKIYYSLFGDENLKTLNVEKFSLKNSLKFDFEKYKEFFYVKNNELHNKKLVTVIKSTIVTPKNLKLVISAGSTLKFESEGQLVVYGGIVFEGNENERIKIESSEDAARGGILVIESSAKSLISFTDFLNLKGVQIEDKLVTGAVNFFKSDVVVKNSSFYNNLLKDDYINIINSEFDIENVNIYNSQADSIDIDFSRGSIKNLKILNSGNDGLDFSGSNVDLQNIFIQNSTDKAISVGENSQISANNINIEGSFIGIAVKDGSNLKADKVFVNNNKYDYVSFIKKVEYGSPELNIINSSEKFKFILGEKSKIKINGKTYTEVTADITENVRELLYN